MHHAKKIRKGDSCFYGYLRIDDRLIHGQIVTAWCGHLKINEIIAIDDALAANKTLQSIMLMGIPKQYKSHVVTMAEAKEIFAQPSDGQPPVRHAPAAGSEQSARGA